MQQRFSKHVRNLAMMTICFAWLHSAHAEQRWNGYQTLWTKAVRSQAPCATSLIQPPSENERCIRWSPRFAGGPSFHEELRLVLVGADDNMLKAFSLQKGDLAYETKLPGNLAARPTLTENHAVMGTEDGFILKLDAANGTIILLLPEPEKRPVLAPKTITPAKAAAPPHA